MLIPCFLYFLTPNHLEGLKIQLIYLFISFRIQGNFYMQTTFFVNFLNRWPHRRPPVYLRYRVSKIYSQTDLTQTQRKAHFKMYFPKHSDWQK